MAYKGICRTTNGRVVTVGVNGRATSNSVVRPSIL